MGKLGIVKPKAVAYTREDLQEKFPAKKLTINQDTVDLINASVNDPEFSSGEFMDALVTYQNVMIEGSYSMKEYVNALRFVAFLESEDGLTEAYKKARCHDQFVIDRINEEKDSQRYRELTYQASRYRKTPLVRQLLTQTDMPLYLMFQAERYKAVAVLANEMHDAAYSKDRIAAADKLLSHVKPPENMQIEMAIGPSKEAASMQDKLNEQLMKIAANQKRLLDAGMDINEVQKLSLTADVIDAEVE